MELFKHLAGVDIVHVPHQGTAAVVKALITGEVQAAFAQMATGRPQGIEPMTGTPQEFAVFLRSDSDGR